MGDKYKVQADGGDGREGAPDGTNNPHGTGESDGGAYPNPHTGGDREDEAGLMGHGGQSDIGYHGTGQLGDEDVPGQENANSATKRG